MLHFLLFSVNTQWFFFFFFNQCRALCACRKLDAVEEVTKKFKRKGSLLCMVNQLALESG